MVEWLLSAIDGENCIDCGLCKRVCHAINFSELEDPARAYAAFSFDKSIYDKSASGGVASSVYKYCIDNSIKCMATKFTRDNVQFDEVRNIDDLKWARDSKYVWSNSSNVFTQYEEWLIDGEKCVFIGMPCQVSALKKYLLIKKINTDNILYIDIICHGMPPFKLLDEHMTFIERIKKTNIYGLSFRIPKSRFVLIAYDNRGNAVYKKPMSWDDAYYRAFSLGLIFRENCYECKYAKSERVGDITIGDYSGLGEKYPFEGIAEKRHSLILANTDRGLDFVRVLSKGGYIVCYERQKDEPLNAKGNPQLREPSIKHRNRDMFLDEYIATLDFESSVEKALTEEFDLFRKNKIKIWIRYMFSDFVPESLKHYLRQKK